VDDEVDMGMEIDEEVFGDNDLNRDEAVDAYPDAAADIASDEQRGDESLFVIDNANQEVNMDQNVSMDEDASEEMNEQEHDDTIDVENDEEQSELPSLWDFQYMNTYSETDPDNSAISASLSTMIANA
jgi:hypothetical protein